MEHQVSLYKGETGERHTDRELHTKAQQKTWGCGLHPTGIKGGKQAMRTGTLHSIERLIL